MEDPKIPTGGQKVVGSNPASPTEKGPGNIEFPGPFPFSGAVPGEGGHLPGDLPRAALPITVAQRCHTRRMSELDVLGSFDRPAWMDRAECLGMPGEIFFPERGESVDMARAICAECAVRELCRRWADEHDERLGIWGGSTGDERRRARRQQRARAAEAA